MSMRFIPTVLNAVTASLALVAGCQQPAQVPAGQVVSAMETPHVEIELTEEAMRIHRAGLLIDGHNDLPGKFRQLGDGSFEELDLTQPQEKLYTDIPRLRRGGVGAQFWAAYVPNEKMQTGGAACHCLEEIDLIHRMVQRYPADFALALTAADVERVHRVGKIACLILEVFTPSN